MKPSIVSRLYISKISFFLALTTPLSVFSENIPTYGHNYGIRLRTSILGSVFYSHGLNIHFLFALSHHESPWFSTRVFLLCKGTVVAGVSADIEPDSIAALLQRVMI